MTENSDANVVLESQQRLSQSMLWRLQRRYFEEQGIDAWRSAVPYYVTSNPFIANAYAKVVFGFLRDRVADKSFDASEPLYLIELGAGSGHFAFHFLQHFGPMLARSTLKELRFMYVMTDFSERVIDFWQGHPSLRAWVEAGHLDFGHFDAESPGNGDLHLIESGITLSSSQGAVKNPLVVVANYFFDSIPQDCYAIKDSRLFENLVTLSIPASEAYIDSNNPALLKHLVLTYDQRPAVSDIYGDPELDRILEDYSRRLNDTTLMFPSVGLRCLRHFHRLSGGRMLLLSGDKGHSRIEDLENQSTPQMAVHGSFSLEVNFHALGQYVEALGGKLLQTPHRHAALNVTACVFGPHVETAFAYDEAITRSGPDDFYSLKRGMAPHYQTLTLAQILACLRWSAWDSSVFLDCVLTLIDMVKTASDELKAELHQAVDHIWAMYFPIGEDNGPAFQLGKLLYEMADYTGALLYFERAWQVDLENPAIVFNIGLCHMELRQWDAAAAAFDQTLKLYPSFELARVLRSRVQAEQAM